MSTYPSSFSSTPAEEMYDVFISGAGPVGLFLAYQLERMGHSVYCCDTKPGPTDQSRSTTLSARTLEVLALNGLAAPFCRASVTVRGYRSVYKGQTVGIFNVVDGESTAFPSQSGISQSKVEEILTDAVESKIHWRTELVDYYCMPPIGQEEKESIVVCTVRPLQDDLPTRTIKARYLVGADGTHSFVRKHYRDISKNEEWNFDGYSIGTRFVLCDAKLGGRDADRAFNNMDNLHLHKEGKDYLRVILNQEFYFRTADRTKTHGIMSVKPPSIEELNTQIRRRLAPLDIFITETRWLTVFRINQRKADGFRRGQIFLVGDSSHCFSPVYGLGLNNGFQDAHNLAWKLSLVLKAYASDPEELLNSFSVEREDAAASTMDVIGKLTEIGMQKQNFLMAALGRFWIAVFTSIGWFNYGFTKWIMQSSPLVVQTLRSKLIPSGHFMPNTAVLRRRVIADRIVRKTLHEILADNGPTSKYVALWVSTRPSSHEPHPWTPMFWTRITRWRHAVRPLVVESTWHVCSFDTRPHYALNSAEDDDDAFWMEDSLVYPDALTNRIGLGNYIKEKNPPAALVVIRPDNYIAYSVLVRSPTDLDGAFAKLATFVK
ncbi:FAD binding domain-containing protein [Dichotomocladium elegans]|nr:FAD binding domain-containing protein [Dichotomocladium elegans]